jgi:hypothetical protein
MAKSFHDLKERLLEAGVAPRHVRRYLRELHEHLADLTAEQEHTGLNRSEAESAALLRLGSIEHLATAMIGQRQFQAWSARLPWAAFALAPVVVLAATWFVALFALWLGWQIWLPGADTPFGVAHGAVQRHITDPANLYFQFDRLLYFGAPILVGWGVALIAARQRLKTIWPYVGFVLIGLLGATAQVYASRTAVPHALGHIALHFHLGFLQNDGPIGLLQAMMLPIIALPYLLWSLRNAQVHSA